MNNEQLKTGLERFASPLLDPSQYLTVHVTTLADGRQHQTPLLWHEVASAALEHISELELIAAKFRATPEGKTYTLLLEENLKLGWQLNELLHARERQAARIAELQAQVREMSALLPPGRYPVNRKS